MEDTNIPQFWPFTENDLFLICECKKIATMRPRVSASLPSATFYGHCASCGKMYTVTLAVTEYKKFTQ